jgi:rhamnopyranosyl-N-acetylglucosaminyl-diphospho-decaprenol beta-1,3/1,4-galactofuranosyltransferase
MPAEKHVSPDPLSRPPRVLTAVVTYNRLKLLQQLVQALRAQTTRAEATLIVDNDSNDGTREWLSGQEDLVVMHQANSGSAGGLYTAAKYAHAEGYDWVWMMDDDTAPRPNALERLLASPAMQRPNTGFVYSLQVYPDGSVPSNDPGPTGPEEWALSVLHERCIPVKRCSFVAMMVSARVITRVGYPMREMFFMGDDHEYSRRIVDAGYRGYCVLDSIVLHDTKLPTAFDIRSWSPVKKRYASRNTVYLIRTSSDSLIRKTWVLTRIYALEILRLFRGTSNLSVIAWLTKGFFFNPKAEIPKATIDRDRPA